MSPKKESVVRHGSLPAMLRSLNPTLVAGEFVFVQLTHEDAQILRPQALFREREGLSAIVRRAEADQFRLSYEGSFRQITLEVYSDLEGVGLTAAVAGALADEGIPANVVAAFNHDHVFVPSALASRAHAVLKRLHREARR